MFFNKSSSFTVEAASDTALDCALLYNRLAVFDAAAGFASATLSLALLYNRLAVFDAAAGFASATLSVVVFCCSAAEAALFTASAAVLSAAPATADESAEVLALCWLTVFLSVFTVESSLGAFCLTTGSVEVVSASTLWLPPT